MRCFIAIEPPAALRTELVAAGADMQALVGRPWRPVAAEKLHLTLRFLGDLKDSQLETVTRVMGAAAQGASPFQLRVRGFGAFPSSARARVFWAGVEDPQQCLKALAGALEQGLVEEGLPPEPRAFRPHITLARLPIPRDLPLDRFLRTWAGFDRPLPVARVALIESRGGYYNLLNYKEI